MKKVPKHFASLFLLVFLCFLGVGSSGSKDSGPSKSGAFYMSRVYVKERLKSPSTAKFCPYTDASISEFGDGRFKVYAYVDAENSFGARLRTYYTCILKSSDGETWTLESLDL